MAGTRWRLVRSWLQNINHKRSARYLGALSGAGSASGLIRAGKRPATTGQDSFAPVAAKQR